MNSKLKRILGISGFKILRDELGFKEGFGAIVGKCN